MSRGGGVLFCGNPVQSLERQAEVRLSVWLVHTQAPFLAGADGGVEALRERQDQGRKSVRSIAELPSP